MYSIKIGNEKFAINDEQLADAVVEECRTKKKFRSTRIDAEETAYFAHV